MDPEIKNLLTQQGEAFDAFKATVDEVKKGDVITQEKLAKIETALDAAVEGKAAIELKLQGEIKYREELEAKIGRMNLSGMSAEAKQQEFELKSFNRMIAANVKARNGRVAEPVTAEGYAAYKAAQDKWLREGDRSLSQEEVKTMQVGSDPDGGYFVTPDMTGRVVKKVYETSEIRAIAAQQTISTDTLQGIEDTGEAGAGYAGERAQGSDTTTPQIGKWDIPVYWLDTEPKATQQLLDDAEVDIEAWLAAKVGDKLSRFENSEFVTGGANKIRGFTAGYSVASDTGSGVTWGSLGYVYTGVSADFAASNKGDNLLDLTGALKNAYLANARWVTRRSVITSIRKFKDGQGNYLWQPSFQQGQPEQILGYPVTRAEDMPALAANSYSVVFGDFAQAYQIVDRTGIRVLRDPYTAKPYVKFYTTKRTGGGVINFEAIKLLKFGTS